MRKALRTRMNLEAAVTPEMIAFARRMRPHDVCLVPERRAELTTEGGLDVAGKLKRVERSCRDLRSAGIRVSLFIGADRRQIDAALNAGAPWSNCIPSLPKSRQRQRENALARTARREYFAARPDVNAGHGLKCECPRNR